MNKKFLKPLFTINGLLVLSLYSCSSGFGTDHDTVEIKQNFGGTLICNSTYNADVHDWQYDISYQYKSSNDSLYDIGSGTYYGREWNKDEQLVQYKNWTILKTGDWIGTDKIIVGDLKTNKWSEYKFTPENIEKDSIWKSIKIQSLLNYCCSETFVDKITNGLIKLHYKFRISENPLNKYGHKEIFYKINETTGQPIMTKIE